MPTELNPKNAFGELLLDLIEAQYGDLDSGIQALVQATGLQPEEVEAIVNGDEIVEDESLLSSIVSAFPDADEDDLDVIIDVATSVDEEDRQALQAQLDSAGGEFSPDGDEMNPQAMQEQEEEIPAGAAYNQNYKNTVNFSMNRLDALEQRIAQFQYEQDLTQRLARVDAVASQYVNNEVLPPSYKTLLIGNFASDQERLYKFAEIANKNGVDVNTMLFATEFALGLLSDAAEFVEFKDFSITDEDMAIAQFSASMDEVVKHDIDAIFNY